MTDREPQAVQAAQEVTSAPQTAPEAEAGQGDGDEAVRAAEDYTPQAWRLTGYYPESYARLMDILNGGILPDWDDDDHNRHEAEFRADLAAHDAEVRAQALAPIRAALANHPRCDIHPDDDPIKCGWKQAVADIQAVLDRQEQPR